MHFCPIPPRDQLAKYLSKRKVWFALAQECVGEYVCFYREKSDDVTVILDNGAYEGAMDLHHFSQTVESIRPDVIVLPDLYLGNAKRSMYLSLGFAEQCDEAGPALMFVPQAEPGDEEGFIAACSTACMDERITWIGIPRCLVTHISSNPLARVNVAMAIKKQFPLMKIHALGMLNGCIPELYYLQQAGVESCDSSWPFNHGDTDSNLEEIDKCLSTP